MLIKEARTKGMAREISAAYPPRIGAMAVERDCIDWFIARVLPCMLKRALSETMLLKIGHTIPPTSAQREIKKITYKTWSIYPIKIKGITKIKRDVIKTFCLLNFMINLL